MKKLEKALIILFAAVFVFTLAACSSYEPGYPEEMPQEQTQPQEWNTSNSPASLVDEEPEYTVVYNGKVIKKIYYEEFIVYSFILTEGKDYTFDATTNTITLSETGYQLAMQVQSESNI